MSEVLLELVEWNREDIEDTAVRVVGFYTHSLAFLGTNQWVKFAVSDLLPFIRGEARRPVELSAEGFNLVFDGFDKPFPIIEERRVIWREKEPRFTFFDESFEFLPPRLRTVLYQTNEAIAEEVSDTYKLEIARDPYSFIFPKDYYARRTSQHQIILL